MAGRAAALPRRDGVGPAVADKQGAIRRGAVSYTHLDVYKRQDIHIIQGTECFRNILVIQYRIHKDGRAVMAAQRTHT